jgi:hypothetical protein
MIERVMKALLERMMMRNMQHKITDKASRKAMGLNNCTNTTNPKKKKPDNGAEPGA